MAPHKEGPADLSICFILVLQETIHKRVIKTYYISADFACRHVVGFGDLSIDVFLQVQDMKYL